MQPMRVVDCGDLARVGAWALAKCCTKCHSGECLDELSLDLVTEPGRGLLQLQVCCAASFQVDSEKLDALFPVSAAPAAP